MGRYLSSVARQNLKTSSLSSSSQHLDNMSTTSPSPSPSPLHPPPPPPLHPASSPRNTPHPQASTQRPQHPPELFHPLHLNKPAPSKHQHYGPNSQGHGGSWSWGAWSAFGGLGVSGCLRLGLCGMVFFSVLHTHRDPSGPSSARGISVRGVEEELPLRQPALLRGARKLGRLLAPLRSGVGLLPLPLQGLPVCECHGLAPAALVKPRAP